jgi:hypothetical protein
MDATERPQERAQPSANSFTRVAVDFPHAVAIVIARSLWLRVIDCRVLLADHVVTPILIRIHDGLVGRNGFPKDALTGELIAVGDHPTAFFAGLLTDNVNDRRRVVVIAAMSWSFVRATARRIIWLGMWPPFSPSALIQLVDLEGLPIHQVSWSSVIQIGLEPLSQVMDSLARELKFARQARGRFALGDSAEQENQCCRALATALIGGATQQCIVAITCPTAIGVIIALRPKVATIGTPALRANKAIGVQVALQPEQAQAIVKQVGNRKIDHAILPGTDRCGRREYTMGARLLDMSHQLNSRSTTVNCGIVVGYSTVTLFAKFLG